MKNIHFLLLGGFLNFFPTSLSARFIIITLAVRALMELLYEHNPIFCPNPELKTLIIYYYKETITTGSVHIMHNNDDNEENFLLGNASGKGVYQCCLVDVEMSTTNCCKNESLSKKSDLQRWTKGGGVNHQLF